MFAKLTGQKEKDIPPKDVRISFQKMVGRANVTTQANQYFLEVSIGQEKFRTKKLDINAAVQHTWWHAMLQFKRVPHGAQMVVRLYEYRLLLSDTLIAEGSTSISLQNLGSEATISLSAPTSTSTLPPSATATTTTSSKASTSTAPSTSSSKPLKELLRERKGQQPPTTSTASSDQPASSSTGFFSSWFSKDPQPQDSTSPSSSSAPTNAAYPNDTLVLHFKVNEEGQEGSAKEGGMFDTLMGGDKGPKEKSMGDEIKDSLPMGSTAALWGLKGMFSGILD